MSTTITNRALQAGYPFAKDGQAILAHCFNFRSPAVPSKQVWLLVIKAHPRRLEVGASSGLL